MKIILINPPDKNLITGSLPETIEEDRGVVPSLGILYIAAYLKKYTTHQIKILDLQLEEKSQSEIQAYLIKEKPDIVGITTITFLMIDIIQLINLIHSTLPETKIILGGPHVHIYPKETLRNTPADFVVLGEGEKTCLELINNLNNKEKLKTIKGLVFKNGQQIIRNETSPFIQNLDELPPPARELTDYQKYYSSMSKKNPTTCMFTSRGCPYKCIFCDRPNLGKIFRARSAKNVVDEMEKCHKLGIKEIFVYDDTFTVDQQRVKDICHGLLERNIKISWDIRARVNTVDQEMLVLLKQAGCTRIHYGVEAGDNQILKNLRKGITVEMAQKAFKLTRQVGIETAAYFMLGNPGETLKEIKKSIKLAKKLKPDYVLFSILTPYPATDIYSLALKQGLIKKDVWQEFAENPRPEFIPPVWEENFSRPQLVKLLKRAYRSFYLRPNYIFKQLLKIKSYDEFFKKAQIAINILKN